MRVLSTSALAAGVGDGGPLATTVAVLLLLAVGAFGVWAAARAGYGSREEPADPSLRAALDGALVALGVLAVADNVVFHWLLGFHRFREGWPGSIYVEVALVIIGAAMVAVGWSGLRRRRGPGRGE